MQKLVIGKGFFEGSTPTDRLCQGCEKRMAHHIHHRQFKGMGGRKGSAKVKSEDPRNKIALCVVCHEATHGIKAIFNGFSCEVCPKLNTCRYGLQVMRNPAYKNIPPNWGPES